MLRSCLQGAVIGGVALLATMASPAAAQTPVSVTVPPVQDCTVRQASASRCARQTLEVGINHDKVQVCSDACYWVNILRVNRSLLQFDLSAVPAGAEVSSASLRVFVQTRGTSTALPVQVRPLLGRWTNAATWDQWDTFQPWTAPGGDLGPVAATGTITAPFRTYTFNVTGLVREWVAGVRPNHGLALRRTEEVDVGTSDAATMPSLESTSTTQRPALDITYTPGTPPNVSLGGSLYAERDVDIDDDRTDSGFIEADEQLTVTASEGAPGAGVASMEMRVDGQRLRAEHLRTFCAGSGCPASVAATFTLHRADVAEGDHEIRVIVRDAAADTNTTAPGAHVSVRRFIVHSGTATAVPDDDYEDVPPPGSAAPARSLAAGADAPTLLSASAAASARGRLAEEALTPGSDLAELLGGTSYVVERTGVVSQGHDASGRPRVIGTLMLVRLAQPRHGVRATIGCDGARPDMTRREPYQARVSARALRDLLVRTDLTGRTVLCASPGPESEATFEPLPGQGSVPAPSED